MAEQRNQGGRDMPVGGAEDVEFSQYLADEDDREAQQRAREADERQECGGL